MGDKSDDDIEHESNEAIFMQIKHLEKQKADLERRNTERQMLEKKFRELRNNVSGQQLSPIYEKGRSQSSTYAEDSISIGHLIQEGREQLQALQSQLAARLEGAGSELELTDQESEEEEQKTSKEWELNLSLDVEDIVGISKGKSACTCREVEEQLLLMAKHAYHNIRRRDETPAAFEQFRKELSQTNEIVRDSMEIMNTLKILCTHGRSINDISSGSILFNLQCSTQDGLKDIWNMYQTGSLQEQFQKSFVTENLKKQYHANDIKLKVTIPEEEFQQCQNELVELQIEKSKMAVTERNLNLHGCTTSANCHLPSTVPVMNPKPERVFREIDKNCPYHQNSSPSKRKMMWPQSMDNISPAKRRTPPLAETDARPVQNFHQRLHTGC
ncbi:hypothetical protein ACJMK2_026431 [Sinanodonta woodiana]|uniref:TRADD-like N-terminal domain-containing protein n=1 Tax=Sinanodonta woodiana TaxID=1069815 RepID=A0ABD3XJL2_SINWO